jgi:hypothetical protein
MGIVVPLEDGSMARIEHLPLDAPTKTLGLMTCPTGSSAGSLAQMVAKATGWKDKACAAKNTSADDMVPAGKAVLAKGGVWAELHLSHMDPVGRLPHENVL